LRGKLEESRRTETIGRLVSGIAHEINNPLASILSFSEQLRAEARQPLDIAALDAIHSEALRSRAIVRDLLAFVRIDDHAPVTPVRAAPLVSDTLQSVRAHVTSLGATLSADGHDGGAWVSVDAQAIEQAITNLVLNAAQSAGPGGTVRVRSSATPERFAVTIEDSGRGISNAALPHLFSPFFTTKPVGHGAGLGLYVARGIARRHGGNVFGENLPEADGPGARFTLELPRAADGPAATTPAPSGAGRSSAPSPPSPPSSPSSTSAPSGERAAAARGRVLLVDDEDLIRASMRRYFTRRGWEVFDASDGAAAVEIITQEHERGFSLILCDLRMPGMGGAELHAYLEAHVPQLVPQLVVASGDIVSAEAVAFLSRTKCRVLEKPFELKELAVLADALHAAVAGDGH
jgi:CheY-like chemotaxis protein